ncbi:unnamed protein product [Somion occarium]|uniref:TRAM domain-containing protein n=1 Tax=Somion occarium TaxID=3059160 RepID=A0ABP1CMA9_9APHY
MVQSNTRQRSPSQELSHIDKKPRLDVETDAQSQASHNAPLTDEPMKAGESSTPKQNPDQKKPAQGQKQKKNSKRKKVKHALPDLCSPEDVISRDVFALLGEETVQKAVEEGLDWNSPFKQKDEVELVVSEMCSSGDSLSIAPAPHPPWIVLTPLALPGEKIRVRIYYNSRLYSRADLLEVVKPNPTLRDMNRVKCKYFGECGGCQYQMLSYETQLDLKQNVVVKAYKNFSGLPGSSVPTVQSTIGSPLQYGYRTKITPHFEVRPKDIKAKDSIEPGTKPDWLRIGFNKVNTKFVMDIEECPIAAPVINEAYGPLREKIVENIFTYKRGVSLLLRESLELSPTSVSTTTDTLPKADSDITMDTLSKDMEKKVCITNHKGTVRERVGDFLFEYGASSFFQNNNSVLVPLTSYVRDAIFPPSSSTPSDPSGSASSNLNPTHLVDAYCGSGLFAITLSPYFQTIAGIELSTESIKAAKRNAELNNLPSGKCSFLEGDASNIFTTVQSFPRSETVLIIDPPRRGSDEKFVDQMIDFGCSVVVYVSCNVHTQARDVGMILRKSQEKMKEKGKEYVLESLRGFDLFPQTAHVESVAVLRLIDSPRPVDVTQS